MRLGPSSPRITRRKEFHYGRKQTHRRLWAPPDPALWGASFAVAGEAEDTLLFSPLGQTTKRLTRNYAGAAGKVVMFDITRPDQPRILSIVDLGVGSGPHYLRLTGDERRLVVNDYFLVEDLAPGGVVHAEGDHKIHVLNVYCRHLELDPWFGLDFNRDVSTGPARPHGLAVFPAKGD